MAARNSQHSQLQVGISCIVGPENWGQLEKLADEVLGEIGVDVLVLKHDVYGRYSPSPEYENMVRGQLSTITKKYPKRVEERTKLGKFEQGLGCAVPYFKSVINPYGELFSCCLGSQPGEVNGYYFGSIREAIKEGEDHPFEKIWKDSSQVRLEMLERVECKSCNFTDRRINLLYNQG